MTCGKKNELLDVLSDHLVLWTAALGPASSLWSCDAAFRFTAPPGGAESARWDFSTSLRAAPTHGLLVRGSGHEILR